MLTRAERRAAQLLSAIAILIASSTALANGRFPRAERLLESPGDSNQLFLAATYGILATNDRGLRWEYVCEASFAQTDAYTGDPLLDFAGNGALLVGVQSTLNVSLNGACSWTPVLGGGSKFVIDYSVVRSLASSTIVAVVAAFENGGVTYSLVRSTDHAATWAPIGVALPVETVYTVDVDASNPDVVYLTGLDNNVGQLLRSADGGATWTAHPIPNTNIGEVPYIAALHPADSRKIFVRTDSWVPIDGDLTANDALLYSSDGGMTWTELIRHRAKLLGFALSPDASRLIVGFGDPEEQATQKVTGPLGVFASAVGDFAFEPILSGHVGCLTWTQKGVYVCRSQRSEHHELAFFEHADFARGGCATPLLRLPEVKGPLRCPDLPRNVCDAPWEVACQVFGACNDGGTSPIACEAGAAGSSGSGGAGADDGGGAHAGAAVSSVGESSGAGCSCQFASRSAHHEMAALVIGWLMSRRRRARATHATRAVSAHPSSSFL